jgi:hypothetical protein
MGGVVFVMKYVGLILVFIVCCPSISNARLGETEAELVKRFGPPRSRGGEKTMGDGRIVDLGPRLGFSQDEWSIISVLIDGRVARESYSKPGKWTEDQIKTVLTANAQGATWIEITKHAGSISRSWRRSDGATASWSGSGMELTHPAYVKAEQIARAKAKAKSGHVPKI